MPKTQFHTIDPLILQTLHLNEERMKRILDILHGNEFPQINQPKHTARPLRDRSALSMHKEQFSLPSILQTHRKPVRQSQRRTEVGQATVATERVGKDKSINNEEEIGSQETKIRKKQQVMRDYLQLQIRKSKSQDLHFKDMYRLDVESLIAEPTEIALLEHAEKKMRRLKQRHQYLKTFDQAYFSRLNQADLDTLQ